jgi:P4 family phage/plasmid primase-like protien
VPEKWDSPAKLAREFAVGNGYRFVKNTIFRFTGKNYEVCSAEYLRSELFHFCERKAADEYRQRAERWQSSGGAAELDSARAALAAEQAKDTPNPDELARSQNTIDRLAKKQPAAAKAFGRNDVNDVAAALAALRQLPDGQEFNAWLPPATGPTHLLSVSNELLDTATGELHPHSADYFSLIHVPVEHRPDAPPPAAWLSFLSDVFEGDDQRIAILQELFGACLAPRLPLKTFAVLSGSGNNGKSVALTVLRTMLGERNTSAVTLDQLTGNRFAGFALLGKLANLIGDQGFVKLKDEGILKTLTGGDLVAFEQKGKDALFAVNTAKIVAAANEVPRFNDASDAIWNRAIILPFNWVVPADKINPALLSASYWQDELPGILRWSLVGLKRLTLQRSIR